MRIPAIPVSASSVPEWIRRAGEAVNRLIGAVSGVETRLAVAEGEIDAVTADVATVQAFIAPPVNLQACRVTARAVTSAPVIGDADLVIGVDASAGAVTVPLLPLAAHAGRVLILRKLDAGANAVTIDGDGTETIDGAATRVLAAQWETVTLVAGPGEWWAV